MKPRDAAALLAVAVPRHTGVWADFGAGDGTFSRALAARLDAGSRIYAVDRDSDALASLAHPGAASGVELISIAADFTRPLHLPGSAPHELDGMLFANALHFVREPASVLTQLVTWLRPGGSVVVVEYDGRRANRWVPYPIDVAQLERVAAAAGLSQPVITATRPSAYGGTIYVARLHYLPA
jgi:trans-aconitate methyltransferase